MKKIEVDFEEVDFAEFMIRELEKDYGRTIARVAKLEPFSLFHYKMVCVFSDFVILEADIHIKSTFPSPTVEVLAKFL